MCAQKKKQGALMFETRHKIKTVKELVDEFKRRHLYDFDTIVFTNGCFDLLHSGHIHLLETAKSLGHVLVVALNTDESVAKLKGPERPIDKLEDRMTIIAALECVDYVISFDELTPKTVLDEIKPNIVVKGGDYAIDEVVTTPGARVVLVEQKHGFSTTKKINKIK